MSEIVVFHSALGLRPATKQFADHLRDDGHTVHTPDLFAGQVFDDLDAGVAHRDTLGIPTLLERAHDSVAALPQQLHYIGFSMGTAPAQLLAATRPQARGVVLVQGALPLAALELDTWPADVPMQLHVATRDPWFDANDAQHIADTIPSDLLDHHEYATDAHLFADPDWHQHDPTATTKMLRAITDWLDKHPSRTSPT